VSTKLGGHHRLVKLQRHQDGITGRSLLNYEESLLIFNHVAASIRFIKSLEAKVRANSEVETKVIAPDDSIPF